MRRLLVARDSIVVACSAFIVAATLLLPGVACAVGTRPMEHVFAAEPIAWCSTARMRARAGAVPISPRARRCGRPRGGEAVVRARVSPMAGGGWRDHARRRTGQREPVGGARRRAAVESRASCRSIDAYGILHHEAVVPSIEEVGVPRRTPDPARRPHASAGELRAGWTPAARAVMFGQPTGLSAAGAEAGAPFPVSNALAVRIQSPASVSRADFRAIALQSDVHNILRGVGSTRIPR